MSRAQRRALILLGLLILLGNLSFGLLIASQRRARLTLAPGASVSDLYPRWLGTRNLLLFGQNPYTDAAALENERGYYGRVRRPDELSLDPAGYQGFAYPLYAALFLAPVALLPFWAVQLAALAVLTGGILWSVWTWTRLVGWPADPRWRGACAAAALASLPVVDLLSLQQLSGFVIPLLVLSVLCLQRNRLTMAGALLAVALIKPQLAALPVLGVGTWVLRDWRVRRRCAAGFLMIMVPALITSFVLLPGWLGWFLHQARVYTARNALLAPALTPLPWLPGQIAVGIVISLLSWTVWARASSESDLARAMATSMAAVVLLVPSPATYNESFLIFPLLSVVPAAVRCRSGFIQFLARIVGALLVAAALAGAVGPLAWVFHQAFWWESVERIVVLCYFSLAFPVWLSLVLQPPSDTRAMPAP